MEESSGAVELPVRSSDGGAELSAVAIINAMGSGARYACGLVAHTVTHCMQHLLTTVVCYRSRGSKDVDSIHGMTLAQLEEFRPLLREHERQIDELEHTWQASQAFP